MPLDLTERIREWIERVKAQSADRPLMSPEEYAQKTAELEALRANYYRPSPLSLTDTRLMSHNRSRPTPRP